MEYIAIGLAVASFISFLIVLSAIMAGKRKQDWEEPLDRKVTEEDVREMAKKIPQIARRQILQQFLFTCFLVLVTVLAVAWILWEVLK